MRILFAVTTCCARRHQADAQRRTWAQNCETRFFVGGPKERHDEVSLDVDDSYAGLPAKVKATMAWACERGYDAVLKVDDDVYVATDRLPRYDADYVGNFRAHNGPYPADYASGFAYFLSRRAMEIVAQAPLTEDSMEDRFVGNLLSRQRNLRCLDEKRFVCLYPGLDEAKFLWGSPIGKSCIAIAQYPDKKFDDVHFWYNRAFPKVEHAVSR